MYAIIKAGGKQYKVSKGTVLKIEKLKHKEENMNFKDVLMISDGDKNIYGNPYIRSANVTAEVLERGRTKKVLVFKQKPRKNHRKLIGHRQPYMTVRIKEITMEA